MTISRVTAAEIKALAREMLAAEYPVPEPYAPGWRPGHLKRGRMTSLAWAVVSG